MNTSSSSAGDQVHDNSVNLQNGGTVVQMGMAPSGSASGQDAYNQGGNQSASNVEYSYNVLDGGAIEEAFKLGGNVVEDSLDYGQEVVERSLEFGKDALDFGEESLGTVEKIATNAIDEFSDLSGSLVDFGEDAMDLVESNSRRTLDSVTAANYNAMDAVKKMAENINKGVASETSGSEKTIIYGIIALVVLVLFFVVLLGFKKS